MSPAEWMAIGLGFVATLLVVLFAFFALTPKDKQVGERLTRVLQNKPSAARPSASTRGPSVPFVQKQRDVMKTTLAKVGQILPASAKRLSYAQRNMVRAGYRRPEAVLVLRGVKLLAVTGLLSLMYFSGAYKGNPVSYLAFAGLAGFMAPDMWVMWRMKRRAHRLRLGLPDALDLLVVCVEAGLGLDQALLRVSQELRLVHKELSEELQLVNLQMRVGKKRSEAFHDLAERTGVDDIKALVGMLIQTDRFGTSVAQSLRVHSEELRIKRRQRAQEAAAKTPVNMVPALVFFIFPALFVVILGPAVISLVRELLPAMK